MSEYRGIVSKLNNREWGTKTIYSWQFEGANTWFRSEFDPEIEIGDPAIVEGNTPNTITAVRKVSAVELAETPAAPQKTLAAEAPPANSAEYWRWKQMYDLTREKQFAWRDARADATKIIVAALQHDTGSATKDGILSLGTKKADKLDNLRACVNTLAEQFVADMEEKLNEC